jgi:hypothetical protein
MVLKQVVSTQLPAIAYLHCVALAGDSARAAAACRGATADRRTRRPRQTLLSAGQAWPGPSRQARAVTVLVAGTTGTVTVVTARMDS